MHSASVECGAFGRYTFSAGRALGRRNRRLDVCLVRNRNRGNRRDNHGPLMMQSFLTTSSLLTATAALMAFQIGLYTLVGRERKSPYVINSVFGLFLLCLTAAAFDIAGALLPPPWADRALLFGGWLLLAAVISTAYVAYGIAIRFVYFIDDPHPKHWPG